MKVPTSGALPPCNLDWRTAATLTFDRFYPPPHTGNFLQSELKSDADADLDNVDPEYDADDPQ